MFEGTSHLPYLSGPIITFLIFAVKSIIFQIKVVKSSLIAGNVYLAKTMPNVQLSRETKIFYHLNLFFTLNPYSLNMYSALIIISFTSTLSLQVLYCMQTNFKRILLALIWVLAPGSPYTQYPAHPPINPTAYMSGVEALRLFNASGHHTHKFILQLLKVFLPWCTPPWRESSIFSWFKNSKSGSK